MKRRTTAPINAMIVFLMAVLLMAGCSANDPGWSEKTEPALGTVSQIRIHSDDRSKGDTAIREAFLRVQEIENHLSFWDSDSQIGRVNANAGRASITMTDDVLFMIEEGLRHYDLTDGLFHIGLGTLTRLWGLNSTEPRIPETQQVQAALEALDLQHIQIAGNDVMIRQTGTAIDLGGIAKGYALDEAARVLRDLGIHSGFLNFGGDVYALGEKPDGEPWYVGIKEPIPGANQLVGRMGVVNLSVMTSGDYERYVVDEEKGERLHHILDPRTGRPAANELASVTIVSDTSLQGDIFSTAAFVMGLEHGYRYVFETPDVEGLFITRDGEVYQTPGLEGIFELMNDNYVMTEMEIEFDE
ncbi:MAG: FAD:protein FMN transferase [Bacillota bacterium]|nr:FAD:protein FMN transferase [Bacillota bacterium]MDW7677940.1 FAD:protein FMN transferase [Bacillota bacterium]